MKSSPWQEGDPNAKLLILGEAPSRVEMRMGRPLIGPSGDVLNDCLHTAGVARRQCYILNVWPFQVTKDKVGNVYYEGECLFHNKGRGFTELGRSHADRTIEAIRASGCNQILALGQIAMSLLSEDKRPIMKWRGSPLWSTAVGRKYIPTVHPAATLHGTYLWRYLIIGDAKKAWADVETRELVLDKRNIIIRPTFAQVYHYFEACKEAGRVCTDLEVLNNQIYCFSLAYKKDEALVVPLVQPVAGKVRPGPDYWSEDEEVQILKMYGSLMSDPNVMKINQNIVGFDAVFLLQQSHIHVKGPLGDTMIAQHILYPDFKKGLDFIASIHTREPYWKDEGKVWKNPNVDWPMFQTYCGKDAAVSIEAWDILSQEMTDGGYWPTYNRTVRLANPLAYMTVTGLAVNRTDLAAMKVKLEGLITEKQAALDAITPWSLNVQSPKQCQKYFYEELGIPPYKNPTGGITTDDKAMSRIFRKGGKGAKEAKLVQELRALLKLKGTYIEVELDPDDRLRCSWNPRGTWTGRLSSSETLRGTGMNLQNLHPEFKGFIVAG